MVATINPLSVALAGLRVAQSQISVASNNIANVSTEGYTRKVLNQYSEVIGEQGVGVNVGNIERRINEILLKDYRRQVSAASQLATSQNYMNQIQDLHGPPDAEASITAQLGKLKDSFVQLTNSPESAFMINSVYSTAQQTVAKFADYAETITQMRNNAQTEMRQSVTNINALTQQIADLNVSIKVATSQQRSTAALEDQRDLAVRDLGKELDVSYYRGSDGVLTVMTHTGQLLADTSPIPVYFNANAIGPQSYYPASVNPVMLGNPTTGTDLTTETSLGGKLGALIDMRDNVLPTYSAQMDELAHKTALRFHNEGLDLFTLPDGTIPANTPSSYAGFAADMIINPAISTDKTLLRKGTNPLSTVQSGSNEILRKVVEYVFGDTEYQRGLGTTAITSGPATLFTELGITGQARVTGDQNIQALTLLEDSPFINPGTNDTFTLQVGAGLPQTITITAGMTASDLISAINTAIPGTAQISSGGQLILTAPNDLTIGAGTLGAAGLGDLGLAIGVTPAQSPSFTVAVGNNASTTVTITSTDTGTQLLTKLNAISGVSASIVGGVLQIVPTEGGDISLVDGLSAPLAALGMKVTDIPHTGFNYANLGAGANLDGVIQGASSIIDYAAQLVSLQSQNAATVDTNFKTEDSYRSALETQMTNSDGVNIDEEMAHLISIQTAYNASAKTISVVQEMLDSLLNAIR